MTEPVETRQRQLREEIHLLERLEGTFLVLNEDTVVTIQRADRGKQKRQLRNTVRRYEQWSR